MTVKEVIAHNIPRRFSFIFLYIMIFFIIGLTITHHFDFRLGFIELDETCLLRLKIIAVVNSQRAEIKKKLENYEYPNGKYGLNISNFDELMIEKGGRPLRSVVISSWRSGSSFFGDILYSHPATFYQSEVLSEFGVIRIRGPPLAEVALTNIRALFNCDYHKLQSYLDVAKTADWSLRYNTGLWKLCEPYKNLCFNPLFLSKYCQLFPFQLIKFTRLLLNVSQALLEDKNLGVRMVFLIRDPRGTMQSRKHVKFCKNEPDCSDPTRVCDDLVSDYRIAVQLKDKYPHNFKVVRFEDIAAEPFSKAKEIFEFYGLDFHSDVKEFLMTHTNSTVDDHFSTYRVTKNVPFHWREDLTFSEVKQIQDSCSVAIKLWGYVLASNETHLKTFNPIDVNYHF